MLATVAAYRRAMRGLAGMDTFDVWYAHADADTVTSLTDVWLRRTERKALERATRKARPKDNFGALCRFAGIKDGVARLNAEPPELRTRRSVQTCSSTCALTLAPGWTGPGGPVPRTSARGPPEDEEARGQPGPAVGNRPCSWAERTAVRRLLTPSLV